MNKKSSKSGPPRPRRPQGQSDKRQPTPPPKLKRYAKPGERPDAKAPRPASPSGFPRKGSPSRPQPPRSHASPPARGAGDDNVLRKTLDRILSRAGVGSRTLAEEWIRAGRVQVNRKVVRDPETWVDPEADRVLLDGRLIRPKDRVYLLLNKPKGYLCTRTDPGGRPTIYQLLQGVKSWVFNVGRLDMDTSGLLILTNDSELGELLTNPRYKVPKTYLVKASTRLTDEQLQQLRDGVQLNDGPTLPAEVTRLRDSEKYTHLEITITEGRNRQVRRMLEAVESKVLKLVRTQIGPIAIAGLEIGKHRPLGNDEVATLKSLAQIAEHRGKKEKVPETDATRIGEAPEE